MRIWVDDLRPAPTGYHWAKTSLDAINFIRNYKQAYAMTNDEAFKIEVLDLDHDAGDYANMGGDYIFVLEWMEEFGIDDIPIRLHTMNPVGRENMRAIIRKNHWKEIF